jgi:hypothetical protein
MRADLVARKIIKGMMKGKFRNQDWPDCARRCSDESLFSNRDAHLTLREINRELIFSDAGMVESSSSPQLSMTSKGSVQLLCQFASE